MTRWFTNQVLLHHQTPPQSSCIATNASSLLARRLNVDKPSDISLIQHRLKDTNYFTTLAAIGDLYLKLGRDEHIHQNVSRLLEGISEFVAESDAVVTNLESALDKRSETIEVLRYVSHTVQNTASVDVLHHIQSLF